ncbi:probable protein arginine N-methyltransferase 3 [Humulus lupulus]|uniref:probable protein arginine N-methyltransferase 3 n=1 Tax=Humulus lupulus TaxID=3486 RepID=UPI002B40B8FE|nr:probable protein arginine N-methyltransferase 3 [Humulus lupulus]
MANDEETLRPRQIEDDDHVDETEDEDEDEDDLQGWDDWREDDQDQDQPEESSFLCLFCDSTYTDTQALFHHCIFTHHFDFQSIRKTLTLDFYASFKLINYVRSQVSQKRCWSCGLTCKSNEDLWNHLHEAVSLEDIKPLWDNDQYLKPFLHDDSLLYSFSEDEEAGDDGDDDVVVDIFEKEELMTNLKKFKDICIDSEIQDTYGQYGKEDVASISGGHLSVGSSSGKSAVNGLTSREPEGNTHDKTLRAYFPNRDLKDVKIVNADYFGSYSSFGIHREMLSDKVRTDAYRKAIVDNPSLLNGAVVMDVGCGTGILSLFSAQAKASRVIAVEASEKMAAVATQIARENGLLRIKSPTNCTSPSTGVVEVVQCMVEDLDKKTPIEPHSVDVLLSEWMGYCLLYESMLSSVLYARDKWLKPGGAILPDTATIIVAGFGKGGTSIPFWENVYGFNMSCVGKELVEGAAQMPIVDVIEGHDLVTDAAVLKTFDLVTMKPDEVDFTASAELEPNLCSAETNSSDLGSKTTWCYGALLWFETGFTSRFCKEMPANLSTSPCTPKTHWSQTILTFREPIAISSDNSNLDRSAAIVGSGGCPAVKISLRISIARASQHRSIDISLETVGVGPDGRKRSWPVQLFNMS